MITLNKHETVNKGEAHLSNMVNIMVLNVLDHNRS